MKYICCVLIGYLVGTINPSYFLAKIHGFDIREKGSGNAGASNALILLGKVSGVMCALFDISKALFVILAMERIFPEFDHVFAVTGVSCILGHIFPFYLKFRGGKGLACLGGMVLAFNWKVFLIMLLGAMIVALVTKYICFVPMTASVIFPMIYGVISRNIIGALILFIATIVICLKHKENIKRILNGTELRLSFLWNKDAELERMSISDKK